MQVFFYLHYHFSLVLTVQIYPVKADQEVGPESRSNFLTLLIYFSVNQVNNSYFLIMSVIKAAISIY